MSIEESNKIPTTGTVDKLITSQESQKPDCMLMVYNVGKPANVGNMIRSAVAFGASSLVVVGNRRLKRFGNQNTEDYLKEIHYDTIDEAKVDLNAKGYTIVGVEIGEGCVDVTTHPFTGNTVFMFGNEGKFTYYPLFSSFTGLKILPVYLILHCLCHILIYSYVQTSCFS